MMQKFPIKIIVVPVLLIAAWLWVSSGSDAVSKEVNAQARSNVVSVEDKGGVSGVIFSNAALNDELAVKFDSAVGFIEQQENQKAIVLFNEIIEQQPQAIEPYMNLASLYAKSNDIEKASSTLKKAINANDNTAVLFESLQSLYAAKAALAYQRALAIDTIDDQALAVNLPMIKTLVVNRPNKAELALRETNRELVLQVADSAQAIDVLQQKFEASSEKRAELLSANALLMSEKEQQVTSIDSQVTEQSLLASTLKDELKQAKEKIAELEQQNVDQINALQGELNNQVAALKVQLDQARILASSTPVASSIVNEGGVDNSASSAQTPDLSSGGGSTVGDEQARATVAIALVQAWARSWAAQDVPSYIAHYESGYRPASGLSNRKWREQRQARLTNKSFIEVTVSNFDVEEKGSEFTVTFSQHYKSNNVDDKIIKRLVFNNNADRSGAKIIAEQVISN